MRVLNIDVPQTTKLHPLPVVLKLSDVTRSPKQGYQWSTKILRFLKVYLFHYRIYSLSVVPRHRVTSCFKLGFFPELCCSFLGSPPELIKKCPGKSLHRHYYCFYDFLRCHLWVLWVKIFHYNKKHDISSISPHPARALFHLLEWRNHGKPWPSHTGAIHDVMNSILRRVNEGSGFYQMFSVLGDVIILSRYLNTTISCKKIIWI